MKHGAELLAHIQAVGSVSKIELVRSSGYVTTSSEGKERLNSTAFYDALLQALGVSLVRDSVVAGRKPTYIAKVQSSGTLTLGKSYTSEAGASSGDAFRIAIEGRAIVLTPIEMAEAGPDADSPANPDGDSEAEEASESAAPAAEGDGDGFGGGTVVPFPSVVNAEGAGDLVAA